MKLDSLEKQSIPDDENDSTSIPDDMNELMEWVFGEQVKNSDIDPFTDNKKQNPITNRHSCVVYYSTHCLQHYVYQQYL